jgi:hypothetical protein
MFRFKIFAIRRRVSRWLDGWEHKSNSYCGELFTRVKFIVTNLGTSDRPVVSSHHKRGSAKHKDDKAGCRDDAGFLSLLSS